MPKSIREFILRFFSRNALRKEIAAVLLLKIIGLFLLWELVFAHTHPVHLDRPALLSHFTSS